MDNDFSSPIKNTTKLSPVDSYLSGSWEALGASAPMLVAFSQLCSNAIVNYPSISPSGENPAEELELLPEAKAILVAARGRGAIELKALNSAFEAPARWLAVYIELDDTQTIAFRDPQNPEITVRFLEGFRQLCFHGLVIHHIYRDFSLSSRGFEIARTISQEEVQTWIDKGTEFGLHD